VKAAALREKPVVAAEDSKAGPRGASRRSRRPPNARGAAAKGRKADAEEAASAKAVAKGKGAELARTAQGQARR
jgi:hypothetical protein